MRTRLPEPYGVLDASRVVRRRRNAKGRRDVAVIVGIGLLWCAGARAQTEAKATAAPGAQSPPGIMTSDPELQDFTVAALPGIVAKTAIPALAVRVCIDGRLAAVATSGVRAVGHSAAAGSDDLWSIGACTETFTAVAIARLVDRGVLSLDARIESLVPPTLASIMHEGFKKATLAQLLAQTAGIDDSSTTDGAFAEHAARFAAIEDPLLRVACQCSAAALATPPWCEPGQDYRTSTFSYVVAAVIACHATHKSWRTLVDELVCSPLGIVHYGFGPPPSTDRREQPWGHIVRGKELVAVSPDRPDSDNPSYADAASRMHISLPDLQKFLEMWIAGYEKRSDFLKPKTFERLFKSTPGDAALGYALGSYVEIELSEEGEKIVLGHSGSNTLWRAQWRYDTRERRLVILASNCGSAASEDAFARFLETLENEFVIRDARSGK